MRRPPRWFLLKTTFILFIDESKHRAHTSSGLMQHPGAKEHHHEGHTDHRFGGHFCRTRCGADSNGG